LLKNHKNQENAIFREDFLPILHALLENHPGLEFLKSHAEFQEKWANTVTLRIYYRCDLNDDGRLSYREYRKSGLLESFRKVCEEIDISKMRDYFSYEHFYVLYCIFWDLEGKEHDNLITKEEFSKYDGHSLSRKAVDRIFAQIPRLFKSGQKDKMGFEDFVWYLLSEEDKTNPTSIEYWFKVVDLDGNGIITPHEIQYFYDEQTHRMQYLDNEIVHFNDILCQLYDNVKPQQEHHFTLKNFLENKHYSSVFFNNILNINKFLAYEQRDPFSKTEIDKNAEYSDWDKFAFYEYQKLTAEDSDDQEAENVLLI
jgi:serine/threonine-protein phosphatase 2A regulatory subunit B''